MATRDRLAARRRSMGFTQESLAHALGVAVSSVSHWEQGSSTPTARHRRPLADQLGVSLAELEHLLDGQVSPNGHAVADWLGHYASLEQGAARIHTFEPVVIPGLLQTPGYATAVVEADHQPVTPEAITHRVEVRAARQRVLDRQPDPLDLFAVVDESVLRRVTGARATMAGQLGHLAAVATRPNVEIRVLPFDGRVHCAAWGAFSLLTAPGANTPFMACAEDLAGVRYHDAPHAVQAHAELFEHLWNVALSPGDTLDLINDAAQEYHP